MISSTEPDDAPDWLRAFREWSYSDAAPQFPSRQEEQEAEWAFRAGWYAREKLMDSAMRTV